jgi:sugar/nucleoside kinase (ribokinase family)
VLQALAPLADWVVFSIDGLRAWAGERHAIWQTLVRQAARQLEQSQLVLHLGGDGAWWHAPGAPPKLLPPPVPSPTPDRGSGADVLRGALVLGLAEGRSPDFAVRWALAAAALAGGGPAPDRASVIRVLAGTPRPSPHNVTPTGG